MVHMHRMGWEGLREMSLRQRLHSLGAYPRTECEGCRKPLYFLGSSVEWLSGKRKFRLDLFIHQSDRPLSQRESAFEGGKAPHLISFHHSALSSRSAHSVSATDLIIYWSNSLSIPSCPAQHPVSDPPQLQHPPSLSALYDHHPTPPISHFPPHNAAPTAAYASPTRGLSTHEHE